MGFSDKNRGFSFEWQRFAPALPGACCGTAIDVVLICGRFTRCGADVAQLFPPARADAFRARFALRPNFGGLALDDGFASVGASRRLTSHFVCKERQMFLLYCIVMLSLSV